MFIRWQIAAARMMGWTAPLTVVVDLTEALPDSVARAADLVVAPVAWHRRGELVLALARWGLAVVCVVDGRPDAEILGAVRAARARRRRVAIRTVRCAAGPDALPCVVSAVSS